jgi:hypothetical protein
MLQTGTNTKLGAGVAGWSIPAVHTCPGRTKLCESICYATSGFFRMPKVEASHASNLQESHAPDFVDKINAQIKRSRSIKAIRIHPSGDFYSEAYVRKWIDIAKANPAVPMWGYTRSWRLQSFHPALKELAELPNIQLWASIDNETKAKGETPPSWLRQADVMDDWTAAPSQFTKCPNLKNKAITCAKCTYCFKPPAGTKQHVVFRTH